MRGVPLPVGSGRKRQGIDDGPCLIENIGFNLREPPAFFPKTIRVLQKNGNVVIGIRARLTARVRAIQHHTVEAFAVGFVQRCPEAFKDGVN